MTRTVAERIAALEAELRQRRALRFSDGPEPERMPVPRSGIVSGWDYLERHAADGYCTVLPFWTGPRDHDIGNRPDDGVIPEPKKGGRRLYATRADALLACRKAIEVRFAEALAVVDRKIEGERLAGADR